MKVALFNVKYSQNLGDGLLVDCLERELGAATGAEVFSLDLAGRTGYDSGLRNRRAALKILNACAPPLRRLMVRLALQPTIETSLRPRWRQSLASVDAVVVGGGNLLSDQDLNFPLKVSAALRETAAAGIPAALYGVGVSDGWTSQGRRLFAGAFRGAALAHAAVRDLRSKKALEVQLGAGLGPVEVCVDPGVLAARHFAAGPAAANGQGPLVALGLTDPLALHYHSASVAISEADFSGWLVELVRQLAERGLRILLFTNGSQEDRRFLDRAAPGLIAAAPGRVTTAPAFGEPARLAACLSAADLVIAHRLHACIAAFAFARPHVGFAWDPKLEAFFAGVGRDKYVARPCADSAADVAELAVLALREGVDPAVHTAVVARAREDVRRLGAALGRAVANRRERVSEGAGA